MDFVSWILDDMLKYVLFTPFDMFQNPATTSILIKMGVVSSALVTVLAMIEGLKRTMSLKYTPMSQIAIRYPIALGVSAFAPFAFYYAGMGVNKVVSYMGAITGASLQGHDYYMNALHGVADHIYLAFLTFFFLIAMFFYLFRILLYHAVRWFGLVFNMVTTPFVMLAFMFKPYEHVAEIWFKDTLGKFFVQVAHSFMLSLIAILLYSPNVFKITSAGEGLQYAMIKLMIAVGGLHMMLNPPSWIRGWLDSGMTALTPIRSMGRLARFMVFRR